MDKLLDANEVGKMFGLHPSTIRRLWNKGKGPLKGVKLTSKALRFKSADVEKFISACEVRPDRMTTAKELRPED